MYREDLIKFCTYVKPIKLSVTKNTTELAFKDELLSETSFLNIYKNVPLGLRYYCVLNSIYSIPKCLCCNSKVNYKIANPSHGFSYFCGPDCSRSNKTVNKQILQKLSNKDWLYEQRIILQKSKELIAEELNCSVVPITKWLKKLEIENPRTDIKNTKIEVPQKTILYADYYENNLTLLDIAKKYDVSNTTVKKWFNQHKIQILNHSNTIKNKVIPKIIKTNLNTYGVPYAAQKHFAQDIWHKLNDPDWLYDQHIVQRKTLMRISMDIGVSDLTIKRYFNEFDIETKLYQFSSGEKELGDFIESYVAIERSNRKLISPKELDIFIPSLNVAIEYNGCWWHSTNSGKSNLHQKEKYDLCRNKGIRLITIYDDEWLSNKNLVKEKLKTILNISDSKKIHARKCIIKTIDYKIKNIFFNENHIQGSVKSSINIGLYYDNELVSVLSFKLNKNNHELVRYATKYNVIGGFSKLLSYFKYNYEWNKIVTFADLRWHTGNVYLKSGFIIDGYLPPDYEYVVNGKRSHKFNYRKKCISTKFPNLYNSLETEEENMKRIGIPKIYDCGKIRFVLKK